MTKSLNKKSEWAMLYRIEAEGPVPPNWLDRVSGRLNTLYDLHLPLLSAKAVGAVHTDDD
jgi:hypothetical protein